MGFLQKKVFDYSPPPFGLDVSDLSLKALWFSREGDRERVESFGSVAVPQGAILDGEIINEDAVVVSIKNLLATAGPKKIRTRRVICSLPETKAFLRIISIPKMSESELKEAMKWEIEANIPLALDQVYFDWQILPQSLSQEKGKMSVLVVAVSVPTADQFHSVLEKAGLEVVGLETESIAQARSLLSETVGKDGEQTVLIVDIGDRRSSFVMAIGNVPVFTSSIHLSSQMMTDAISKEMNIPFIEAEKLKIRDGLGSFALPTPQMQAVRPILENLAIEIERSMDFYFTTLQYSDRLDAIVFCGGGANMQGLLPYFAKRLRQHIEFGNPWVNARFGDTVPPISRERSSQYSTVIGLALRGLDEYESIA